MTAICRYILDCSRGDLTTAYIGRIRAFDDPRMALDAMLERQQEPWERVSLTPVHVQVADLRRSQPHGHL